VLFSALLKKKEILSGSDIIDDSAALLFRTNCHHSLVTVYYFHMKKGMSKSQNVIKNSVFLVFLPFFFIDLINFFSLSLEWRHNYLNHHRYYNFITFIWSSLYSKQWDGPTTWRQIEKRCTGTVTTNTIFFSCHTHTNTPTHTHTHSLAYHRWLCTTTVTLSSRATGDEMDQEIQRLCSNK